MMKTIRTAQLKIVPEIALYALLLYGIWFCKELLLMPFLMSHIESELIVTLLSHLLKNLVWTLPALLLIRRHNAEMRISMREMFRNKPHWKQILFVCGVFVAYFLLANHSRLSAFSLTASEIVTVLLVGAEEELVFRGLFWNSSVEIVRPVSAMLLNMLMFLAVHFPIWLRTGAFVRNFQSFGFVTILLLSWIFTETFRKERNILAPILLHSVWDLLAFGFGA